MRVFICALLAAAAPLAAQDKIEAVTKPSQDTVLSFVRPGQVAEVLVKEGDAVKAGQVLMRQDDKAELAQMEQLKAQAEDNTRVRATEAQLEQKRVDLRKTEGARKEGAATELEVDHAKLEVVIGELSLELAQFEQKQAKLKYQEMRLQIDRMRVVSPIDGVVERLLVEPGESVEAAGKIAQVVQIDPLWIDVAVPLAIARTLKRGESNAVAEFDGADPARRSKVNGKIIHIAAVADSASGTLTVRVECPNAARRPAGEHVYVSFPAQSAPAPSEPARLPAGGDSR
jgi:RND family efflux transporter MFP subunit